jgi:hypothetical protein
VEKSKPILHAGGHVTYYNHFRKQFEVPQMSKHRGTKYPTFPLIGTDTREMKVHAYLLEALFIMAKVETAQIFIS